MILEIGAIVFFRQNGRIKTAWVSGIRDDGYRLFSNGLCYTVPACEILTGWEPDFPTLDKVERSRLPEPDYEEFDDDALYELGFADDWHWSDDKDYLEELEREYAMPRKKKPDPNQGSLFERPMTSEDCKKAGGDSWKADPENLGKSEDGKNIGWCKKKQGWF